MLEEILNGIENKTGRLLDKLGYERIPELAENKHSDRCFYGARNGALSGAYLHTLGGVILSSKVYFNPGLIFPNSENMSNSEILKDMIIANSITVIVGILSFATTGYMYKK